MNENLDLTIILKGCPEGTEFYSSVYGRLKYLSMYVSSSASKISFAVVDSRNIIDDTPITIYYYRDGKIYPNEGECTLFPSRDHRDWSKFERFWDKPKVEKFDPKTLKPFDKVLVRNDSLGSWRCDLLSHFNKFSGDPLFISTQYWHECIPYNEDTKYLLGTKREAPEYYKWWEE